MDIKRYDNVENMLEDVQRGVEAATQAAHIPVKEGDYVLRVVGEGDGEYLIFGHLESPLQVWFADGMDPSTLEGEELAEYEYEREHYADMQRRGYYFGRWFSVRCPHGELGSAHASNFLMTIDKDAFDQARALGWDMEVRVGSAGDA